MLRLPGWGGGGGGGFRGFSGSGSFGFRISGSRPELKGFFLSLRFRVSGLGFEGFLLIF